NPLVCAIYGLDTLAITSTNLSLVSSTHPLHLSALRALLHHPNLHTSTIDAPQEDIHGVTPLCLASYLGKAEVVSSLLEEANVNVEGGEKSGATALMYAAREGHLPVVHTLLKHGAAPDLTDRTGWSSVQYGQDFPEIVRVLEAALRTRRLEMMPATRTIPIPALTPLRPPPINPTPRSSLTALPSPPTAVPNPPPLPLEPSRPQDGPDAAAPRHPRQTPTLARNHSATVPGRCGRQRVLVEREDAVASIVSC
ncbi:ankyrin repeat-containing domain protein, partial [Jimgerdemannia flammicorona]